MMKWLLFVASLLLAACQTTVAQQEFSRIKTQISAVEAQAIACRQAAYAKPEFAPLMEKIPSDPVQEPTLVMLNDKTYATDAEIALIYKLHAAKQPCDRAVIEGMNQAHPAFTALFAEAFAKADARLLKLVNKKVTWGEAHQLNSMKRAENIKRYLEVANEITNNLQAAHQNEAAYRQCKRRSNTRPLKWS